MDVAWTEEVKQIFAIRGVWQRSRKGRREEVAYIDISDRKVDCDP